MTDRLNAAFDAAWDRAANGEGMSPEGLTPDELLHARIGFLTGMLHAAAQVPAGFRSGWNAHERLDLRDYLGSAEDSK